MYYPQIGYSHNYLTFTIAKRLSNSYPQFVKANVRDFDVIQLD